MSDTSVNLCGINLKNPIIAASGCFGYGMEYNEFYPVSKLGAISCTGTTIEARIGNPGPRVIETPAGMLNSVGLQNPGIDMFLKANLPWLKENKAMVILNVAGNTLDDYIEIVKKIQDTDVDMVELNISCPNVKQGGVSFGTSVKSVEHVTAEVKKHCKQPLMVKLTPNVTSVSEIAKAAQAGGADAISLINTLTGMRVDIHKRRPMLKNNTGGMSGPALFPVALRMVSDVYKAVDIPVVGLGGISKWQDAVEMMIAGASAVQVGTANFRDPYACIKIIDGLKEFTQQQGLDSVTQLTGTLEEF